MHLLEVRREIQQRAGWFRGSQVARHHVDTQVATLNAQLDAKTPPQPKP
jgi:hypothetical protein